VSGSRIQVISKGRRAPFARAPDFSSADHPWAGYVFEETYSRNEPIKRGGFLKTTIFLCTGGQGTAHRQHRGVWEKHRIRPGSVFLVRRETEIQAAWTTNSWPTMLLQLDDAKLHHMAPGEVDAIEKSLVSALTTDDARLAELMQAMREEVRSGCPSGRLYGESMSLALLAYLAGKYATPRPTDESKARLSVGQRRVLVDYIRANLASNISVTELAGLVQMSPSHFARMFRASFGATPYRFVMQERILGAKDLLATTTLSATQVAIAFGFSSQSHFTKVFQQFAGVTPKQYKSGF
jgi:AraC family transcriptional regulator